MCGHTHTGTQTQHICVYIYICTCIAVYHLVNKYSLRAYHMVGTGDKEDPCPEVADIPVGRDRQ